MTPEELRQRWKAYGRTQRCKVLPFYGHTSGHLHSFSNFYEQTRPTLFVVPDCCWHSSFDAQHERRHLVLFSEKSIMLCKAALFRDHESFDLISAAETPQECKQLGRCVKSFNEDVWALTVCAVASSVVRQKFCSKHLDEEREVLLGTGDLLIAEAAPRDAFWGIGAGKTDPTIAYPGQWRGANILGWALMGCARVAESWRRVTIRR